MMDFLKKRFFSLRCGKIRLLKNLLENVSGQSKFFNEIVNSFELEIIKRLDKMNS